MATVQAFTITADAIAAERARVHDDLAAFDFARVVRAEALVLPSVGPDDVRVRVLGASAEHNVVHAALADTVNIVALRGGKIVPGNCFIGEVLETGARVTALRAGDIVIPGANPENDSFGYPLRAWAYDQPGSIGCYAEETVLRAPQLRIAPLDCGLSIWQLAAAPLRAATAYHLWRRGEGIFRLKVPRDKLARLNVLAFGGGVSEFFLMLAHAEGHRAFSCAGNAMRRMALAAQGIEPIDQSSFNRFSTPEDVRAFARTVRRSTDGAGMHVVCDMFRGPVFAAGLAALAREGVDVSAGWQLSSQCTYNSAALSLQQVTIDHVHFETVDGCGAAIDLLGSVFRPHLHSELYAFADLPRALGELHRGEQTGIPVVRIAGSLPPSVAGIA